MYAVHPVNVMYCTAHVAKSLFAYCTHKYSPNYSFVIARSAMTRLQSLHEKWP